MVELLYKKNFGIFLGKMIKLFNSLINLFENYGKANKKKIWDDFSKLIDIK